MQTKPIKLTFEFDSPDAAIVFLGHVAEHKVPAAPEKAGARQPAGVPASAGVPPSAPAVAGPKRPVGRPKKDKGAAGSAPAPGGPVPTPPTPAAPAQEVAAPAKNPPVEEVVGSAPTPAAAATIPTDEEVLAVLQESLKAVGMPKTRSCFARFGVTRGAEVKPERRAEFIVYVKDVIAGKIDPDKAVV